MDDIDFDLDQLADEAAYYAAAQDDPDEQDYEPEDYDAGPVESNNAEVAVPNEQPASKEPTSERLPAKPEEKAVAVAAPARVDRTEFKTFFSRMPIVDRNQVTITLPNGERVFCGTKPRSSRPSKSSSQGSPDNLHQAIQSISSTAFARLEERAEMKLLAEKDTNENESVVRPSKVVSKKQVELASKIPLVQRFRPQRFIELLSHEKRNRDALKWLRSWDNPEARSKDTRKILLLTGPPGSGKTTLAHVLAQTAGYHAVEINASDERSAQGLKEKLNSATEMRSVLDQSGRHNLVILDEIDGISDGVQTVVQYATGTAANRPLICTCNDAYAPALRPLRRIAMILTVNQPARPRLVRRLKEICALENVDQRPGALEMLAVRMENDLRACLNALDFFIRSSSSETKADEAVILDVEAVKSLPTFAKDSSSDLWTLWRDVLLLKQTKRTDETKPASPLDAISRHMADINLVVDGVHENMLRAKYMDPTFKKTHRANEWLCFVDMIQTRVGREMDFSFQNYAALGCIGVGDALAGASLPTRMAFPATANAFRLTKGRNEESLKEFYSTPFCSQILGSRRAFATEAAPFLLLLLVPKTRSVPSQAMLPSEREEIDRVLSVMETLGVCWMSNEPKLQPNHIIQGPIRMWTLDPNVDKIGIFGEDSKAPVISSDLARSLNARLRKRSRAGEETDFRLISTAKRTDLKKDKKDETEPSKSSEGPPQKTTEPLKKDPKTQPKDEAPIPTGMKRDFFGRIVPQQAQKPAKGNPSKLVVVSAASMISESDFVFRFNEGLTDAVRRIVKPKDLL